MNQTTIRWAGVTAKSFTGKNLSEARVSFHPSQS